MKQIQMTQELASLIKSAVGQDVDPTNFAVFEAIALNTKPLPGKRGSIFERAVTPYITLSQMVTFINAGNHLPIIADHELSGAPKGRFFHAGLNQTEDGPEMRALFYLDPTEENVISKLNAGSLDEVSVQFLPSAILCSECSFDYIEAGTTENLSTRTCANGHVIGEDGVHAELVGLGQFVELSLVARGAADKPKIVGKSEAKLAPENTYRLAARGFEPDALVVRASMGQEDSMTDTAKLMSDLVDTKTELVVLTRDSASKDNQIVSLTADKTSLEAQVVALTTERDTALAATGIPEDYQATKDERDAAVALMGAQYDRLLVASAKPKVEGDARPKTVAEFSAAIEELTNGLTAILPVGGRGKGPNANGEPVTLKTDVSAFTVRK